MDVPYVHHYNSWLVYEKLTFSLLEGLILASTNLQYDNRFFIDENYKLITFCAHKLFWMSKQKQKTIYVNNIFHVLTW